MAVVSKEGDQAGVGALVEQEPHVGVAWAALIRNDSPSVATTTAWCSNRCSKDAAVRA